ncbi:MAG: hypothetical protein Q4C15_00570 [Eubacteriales bacterium]|nr:hypothetical protein [Eubacteriales bacterium]
MDTEKKEVKAVAPVATPAPAAAPKAEPAKKPAAKKVAAKKPAKKAATAKKAEIIFQIDGQEISAAAIAKKLPKAGKIYVVANEKKAYDVDGNGVDLF